MTAAIAHPGTSALARDVARRRDLLDRELERLRIDAAVIAGETNVTYLSGYVTASWANRARPLLLVVRRGMRPVIVLSAGEAARAIADGVDVEASPYEAPVTVDGQLEFMEAASRVARAVLGGARVSRLGLELSSHFLPCLSPRALDDVARVASEVVDIAPLLWRIRARKSAFEIEHLRRSATVLGDAFGSFAATAAPGMTERELHRAFAAAAFAAGADRVGYTSVIAGIEDGALGGASDRRWEAGRLLLVDAGVVVHGYWADFCRIYAAGEASAQQRQAYGAVVAATGAMKRAVRAGATAGAVASAGGSGFYGRVGHGLGLDITEPPSLHVDEKTVLEEGMTLCLEPNVGTAAGYVAAEEEVVVEADGWTLLSPPFPNELEVIT